MLFGLTNVRLLVTNEGSHVAIGKMKFGDSEVGSSSKKTAPKTKDHTQGTPLGPVTLKKDLDDCEESNLKITPSGARWFY